MLDLAARLPRITAVATALLLATFATGCSSTSPVDQQREYLEEALILIQQGDLQPATRRMDRLLVAAQDEDGDFVLQRFYALYLLAQIHATASLDAFFLTEHSRATSRIGSIGRRDEGVRGDLRPSETGHLVASVYHASMARALYDKAARSGPKKSGATYLPDSLWNLGVDNADANLQIVLISAYGRLGFRKEVEKTLRDSPTLLTLAACVKYLDDYNVLAGLRPSTCAMISQFLREENEEEAYRFAIAAIEGNDRFGASIAPEAIAELEDWILNGASVVFVCPESQTPYIPGENRSQVSGVPHMDYIAVERLDN